MSNKISNQSEQQPIKLDEYNKAMELLKVRLDISVYDAVHSKLTYKDIITVIENSLVLIAYKKYKYSQARAALELDINRGTFRKFLKRAQKAEEVERKLQTEKEAELQGEIITTDTPNAGESESCE